MLLQPSPGPGRPWSPSPRPQAVALVAALVVVGWLSGPGPSTAQALDLHHRPVALRPPRPGARSGCKAGLGHAPHLLAVLRVFEVPPRHGRQVALPGSRATLTTGHLPNLSLVGPPSTAGIAVPQ